MTMFCRYCGKFLSDTWRYCPHCGRKIEGDPLDLLFRRSIGGFSIRITSVSKEKLTGESREKESPHHPSEESTFRLSRYDAATIPSRKKRHSFFHRDVLEPEGETHHIGKHTIIQVKLPGVKEEDIDIRKLEESIEIKAFKNDTAYFKQVQVPQSSQILSHHLEGDELIIEVG